MVATNLGIDEKLLEEAVALGGHRTKRATVNEALSEYVKRRQRLKAVEHFGTFDFDPEFDHKQARGALPLSLGGCGAWAGRGDGSEGFRADRKNLTHL